MKAISVKAPGGYDNLELVDLPDPGDPGPGEIRVRLHATTLNRHDLNVLGGKSPAADGRIPMADGAGVVEAVGAGVGDFAVGDNVVSCFYPLWQDGVANVLGFATTPGDGIDGSARELVVTAATAFTKAPKSWSHAEAATITTAGLTAWRALSVEGKIKAGESVLVMGSGGVSVLALQYAKAMGATVIATSSSDAKLERFRALGAAQTVNYAETPEWGPKVRELTGGKGADHVVEVGGAGTLPQAIQAVAVGGHITMIGVLTGAAGPVPTAALMVRQARIQGVIVGSRKMQQDLVAWLDTTDIRPIIDRSFPLEQLAEAARYEESGAHFGKIAIEW